MIDGHGDDSYKYSRPITANFSSNVYSKVNLSRLKAHLCECIGEIGNYPEPEPYTLEARIASRCQLPSGAVCVTNGATEAIYLIADFPGYEYSYPATHFQRICGCLPYTRTPGEFALSTAEGAGRVSPAGRCADAVALQPQQSHGNGGR